MRFKEYLFVLRNLLVCITFWRSLLLCVEDQAKLLYCLQLIGSMYCKPVGEAWPETIARHYHSRSVIVLRRCRAIKCKASWQRNEILVSVLLGIEVTVRFCFELRLTYSNRMELWSAKCWQVNQHQHVFAGQCLCAKTFKSCVGSGDSSTRD